MTSLKLNALWYLVESNIDIGVRKISMNMRKGMVEATQHLSFKFHDASLICPWRLACTNEDEVL